MTAENKMQFPFTNQKEILHWEALYIKAQKEERQRQEEDVRKIKCSVEDKGYLTKCELMEMARWKDRFARSNIKKGNSPGVSKRLRVMRFVPAMIGRNSKS